MSNKNQNLLEQITQLQGLSKTLTEKVNVDMNIMNLTISGVMDGVPEKDRGEIEKLNANINKIITLSKQGRQTEVQQIINSLQNECKNKK
jgi:hypothetical protein